MVVPKLDDVVRGFIWTYPSLFRCRDWENSRLRVLEHMFMCYGTALEWNGVSHLYYIHGELLELSVLPDGYFEKTLWNCEVFKESRKEAALELNKRDVWYYFRDSVVDRKLARPWVIFECPDEATAKSIVDQYRPENDRRYIFKARNQHPFGAYPMSDYSPLVEMLAGHAKIPGDSDDLELTEFPADWVEGACDIAQHALDYYLDPTRYVNHVYYPKPQTNTKLTNWENHRQQQLRWLCDFLRKFKPSFVAPNVSIEDPPPDWQLFIDDVWSDNDRRGRLMAVINDITTQHRALNVLRLLDLVSEEIKIPTTPEAIEYATRLLILEEQACSTNSD